jgi:hypothetical protein
VGKALLGLEDYQVRTHRLVGIPDVVIRPAIEPPVLVTEIDIEFQVILQIKVQPAFTPPLSLDSGLLPVDALDNELIDSESAEGFMWS